MNISYTNYNGDTVNFISPIKWNQVIGLGSETEYVTTQNPFGDGETVNSHYVPSRRIQMSLIFLGDSEAVTVDMYQDTLQYLSPKLGIGYLRFVVSGVLDAKANCYLESSNPAYDLVSGRRVLKATIIFFAPDPHFYDTTETTVTVSGHGGGIEIPLVVPLVVEAPGAFACTNNGNLTAPFIWTVNGKCDNPTLIHNDTGEELIYNGTVGAGQTLIVSTKYGAQYATLDGVNVFHNLGTSDLFLLQPGANSLTYYAYNESIGSSSTITYSSAWDSI